MFVERTFAYQIKQKLAKLGPNLNVGFWKSKAFIRMATVTYVIEVFCTLHLRVINFFIPISLSAKWQKRVQFDLQNCKNKVEWSSFKAVPHSKLKTT